MKKIIIVFVCCFAFMQTKAQEINSINSMLENFRLSMLPDVRDFDSPRFAEMYDGSPFLDTEWQEGTVTLVSGKTHVFSMKYLVYSDLILTKNQHDSINMLNLSNQIQNIQMNGRTFLFVNYPLNNKMKNGLMESIYDNKSKLLKLYTCRLEKGAETSGYQEKAKDKFLIKETLYCQLAGGNLIPLPRVKKELFQLFGDKSGKVEKYFKEQKMKIKAEKDIAKLLEYYDSL